MYSKHDELDATSSPTGQHGHDGGTSNGRSFTLLPSLLAFGRPAQKRKPKGIDWLVTVDFQCLFLHREFLGSVWASVLCFFFFAYISYLSHVETKAV